MQCRDTLCCTLSFLVSVRTLNDFSIYTLLMSSKKNSLKQITCLLFLQPLKADAAVLTIIRILIFELNV